MTTKTVQMQIQDDHLERIVPLFQYQYGRENEALVAPFRGEIQFDQCPLLFEPQSSKRRTTLYLRQFSNGRQRHRRAIRERRV